jgi:hypothetical protein
VWADEGKYHIIIEETIAFKEPQEWKGQLSVFPIPWDKLNPNIQQELAHVKDGFYMRPLPRPKPTIRNFGPSCDAISVNIEGVDAFEFKLRSAATSWFRAQFKIDANGKMLNELREDLQKRFVNDDKNKPKLKGIHKFNETQWHTKVTKHLCNIKFEDEKVFNQVFTPKKRKKWLKECGVADDCINAVAELVRYGLQGGQFVNMGVNCAKSWTKTGFGFWAHLRGLKFIQEQVLPAARGVLGKLVSSAPGILFRSTDSAKLHEHADGSMENMLERCRTVKSMKEWVGNYGYQALVHMKGGFQDARTMVLAPLTVEKYRLLLLLAKPECQHVNAPPCDETM